MFYKVPYKQVEQGVMIIEGRNYDEALLRAIKEKYSAAYKITAEKTDFRVPSRYGGRLQTTHICPHCLTLLHAFHKICPSCKTKGRFPIDSDEFMTKHKKSARWDKRRSKWSAERKAAASLRMKEYWAGRKSDEEKERIEYELPEVKPKNGFLHELSVALTNKEQTGEKENENTGRSKERSGRSSRQ